MKTGNSLSKVPLLITGLLLSAGPVNGDILELKNGNILNGRYVGGTAGTIRIETSEGVQVVETAAAIALTFTSRAPTAVPSSAPSAAGAPAVAPPPAAPTART